MIIDKLYPDLQSGVEAERRYRALKQRKKQLQEREERNDCFTVHKKLDFVLLRSSEGTQLKLTYPEYDYLFCFFPKEYRTKTIQKAQEKMSKFLNKIKEDNNDARIT